MIELLFVACLSTAPNECREQSMLYTDISPMACLMGAQPELAKWATQNPGYSIARYQCRFVDTARHDI
ncbi:hypothetical protein [Roseivivax sp. CAU 1761]